MNISKTISKPEIENRDLDFQRLLWIETKYSVILCKWMLGSSGHNAVLPNILVTIHPTIFCHARVCSTMWVFHLILDLFSITAMLTFVMS